MRKNVLLVNGFTTHGQIDVKIRLQDHWIKLWKCQPVSWFPCSESSRKFVNLTNSGDIGPMQNQDKTAKKGDGELPHRGLFGVEIRLQDRCVNFWKYWPVSWLLWRSRNVKLVNLLPISGGIGPKKSQDKTTKKGDGELVHHGLIWRRGTPSRWSSGKIVKKLTCQPVARQPKLPQIRQCDDFRRNRPLQSQDKKRQGKVINWYTTVLFDVEVHPQNYLVKFWKNRPVSWLSCSQSFRNFVILAISGGIGPIQSQDTTVEEGKNKGMMNWFTVVLFVRLQDHWVKLWIYRPVSRL